LGDEPKLRAYIVWVPMIDGDSVEAARLEASLYRDKRISHYWDQEGTLATEVGERLGLKKKAWDVYLVYDRKARWDAPPAAWMHQLNGVELAPFLDSVKLRAKVDDLTRP